MLSIPVTDIVRTGDKAVIPQEGLKKASGGKVHLLHCIMRVCFLPQQRTPSGADLTSRKQFEWDGKHCHALYVL